MSQFHIRDCINPDFVSLKETDSINAGRAKLLEFRVAEIFIINDNNELSGIVPDYDLLKRVWLGANLEEHLCALMSPISLAVTCSDSLETVIHVLSHHVHPRIAVVEDRKLLGTIDRFSVIDLISERESNEENTTSEHDRKIPSPKYIEYRSQRESGHQNSPHNR